MRDQRNVRAQLDHAIIGCCAIVKITFLDQVNQLAIRIDPNGS